MDFVSPLPRTSSGYEIVWVIVDRLTKTAHFIPLKVGWFLEKLAHIYIREIVHLYGVPVELISDRDPRFVSHFWHKLHEALGMRLQFRIAFHP